jgi:hypothetical protein
MAWDNRGQGRYYYKSVRIGKQVVRRYVGTGPLAEFVAEKDAEARANRLAAAEACELLKSYLGELDESMEQHRQIIDLVTSGVLMAAGYHQPLHRTCWIKRYGRRQLKAG